MRNSQIYLFESYAVRGTKINPSFVFIRFQERLGGAVSIQAIQYPQHLKVDQIRSCFWTTHMILCDEETLLNASLSDGKLLRWKLVDEQQKTSSSSLTMSSHKLIGIRDDRFTLEYRCSIETSLGFVTAFGCDTTR